MLHNSPVNQTGNWEKSHKEREMFPVKTGVPAPSHPSANDSNLSGKKRKRERIWDVLPEAKRRCMHRRGNGLNLLCRLLDPPEHLLSPAIRHHCLRCTAASHGCSNVPIQAADYFEFLLSVSETRQRCGESEAETGRNSQLCGQGEISSPNCTAVFLQSSH